MLGWLKKRETHSAAAAPDDVTVEAPQGEVMSGKYRLLHKYLEDRYANRVVLTFSEIEDLLGFALPDPARVREEWWTAPDSSLAGPAYSNSWVLARRTATPNLPAGIVVFERAA
jgi:hypothetical protein